MQQLHDQAWTLPTYTHMELPATTARRLLADLKQLRRERLPTCNAEPAGDDLRHWRLSLTCSEGPHVGTIFHGEITFPDDYPTNPPTIQLCTRLAHPNVFQGYDYNQHTKREEGYYICLNMLRPPEDGHVEAYSGWSSAYTVHAILMQLSSFLFAENIPQDHGGSVRCRSNLHGTKRDADAFHAKHGHNYPPVSTTEHQIQAEKTQELSLPRVASADERCRRSLHLRLGVVVETSRLDCDDVEQQHKDPFDRLPDEIVLTILQYLEPRDLATATKTNRVLCQIGCRYNVWERREALCFHSKVTMDEETLGLGFSIEYHGRSADIKGIHAELDLLSQSAYDSGVRRGVWQERFDQWVPLWLCDEHGEHAWPRLLGCVHHCATGGRIGAVLTPTSKGDQARRRARQYLEFFGKAMNSFVVSMMDNTDDNTGDTSGRYFHQEHPRQPIKQKTALHASERALLGYCSFHHLLLAFCARFPLMREEANAMVARAVDGHTSKDDLPDLGVFLALLTVTDQSWFSPQLAWAVLGETLDRNVRWALPNMPYLRRFERTMTHKQAENVCKAETLLADWAVHTATSRRVLMFQAYFLTVVGRPKAVHPSVVLNHYNRSLGRPTARMVENLRVACGEIMATSDWPGFFNRLGLPLPTKVQVATRLRAAVENSRKKSYHGTPPKSESRGGGYGPGRQRGRR